MSKDLFDDMMDFIDAKFQADETSYSEVIGTLATIKTMYEARWNYICNDLANEEGEEECQCGCAETCVPKLQ